MANRFWKAQPVSGAIVSVTTPPEIRLTVASTTGMTTGDTRTVFGVAGTTEANGTWVITVIDGTNIDLQGSTFANLYTSGGAVNGRWDTTNTNNWVTTSGGTNYGQTVPGSGDAVTLDGSSGGGVVTVNATITVQSIVFGAFTGTLDFSANNNNVTLSAAGGFNGAGSGTRTLNLGNGTWTLSSTAAGTAFNLSTVTNLTFNANSSTINYTGAVNGGAQTFSGGGLSYNIVTFGAVGTGTRIIGGVNTIATLNITAPNYVQFPGGVTTTITNAFNWAGSSSSQIAIETQSLNTLATISVATGSPTMSWAAIREIAFTGGATFTATNSFNLGHNTGITITPPSSAGGGGSVYGGLGGVVT